MSLELFKIRTEENQIVTQYRMSSGQMAVDLLSYGAAIQGIQLLENRDEPASGSQFLSGSRLALSLEAVTAYRNNPLYAGATLAPNAGRISDGRFALPQGVFSLTRNDGNHQLHGGYSSLSFCNWEVSETRHTRSGCSVTFTSHLSDGVDGYPGNRRFTVRYLLTANHALMIRYEAVSDCPTYINMANHAYFNLLGDYQVPIDGHRLSVAASRYTVLRPDHIPAGISGCASTPFDFSSPCTIGEQAKKYPRHPQLEIGHGYNHGFLLDSPCDFPSHRTDYEILESCRQMQPSLTLGEPLTGRQMQVYTDAPCIVLYSGGFIGSDLFLEGGIPSSNSCALAIECQDVPDTPNFVPDQMVLTTPTHPFCRTTIYQFHPISI